MTSYSKLVSWSPPKWST